MVVLFGLVSASIAPSLTHPYRRSSVMLIRRLLGYTRPHRGAIVGCVALLMVFSCLALLQPYLIKTAIDHVMAPAAMADAAAQEALWRQLWPLALAYGASVLAGAAIEYAQAVWLAATGQAIIARIRQDVFDHLQGLDLAFFDANPVGRLVTRVTNDVEALNEMYTSVLVNLFKDLFYIVGAMIIMLRLDWRLGEKWFWDTLVDADLANNAFGWQWVAGSGADASPYFRIFNPMMQGEKFDPNGDYVRRWCPELTKLPNKFIHAPFKADDATLKAAGVVLGNDYPKPIVEHDEARKAAMEGYKKVRKSG